MSKQESKILDGVRPHLAPGEEPLVAIVVQPKGTTKSAAGIGALGAAGSLLGSGERKKAIDAAADAGLALGNPCAIVLTPQRLLTVKIGAPLGFGLGGKVKGVLSSVPVTEVDGIEVRKIALRQNITLHVRGEQISLEANAAARAGDMASALTSLKS